MSKKLLRRLIIMLVIVLGISAAVIYFTFDIRAIQYLTMFSPWSVLAALGVLAVGLFFDGLRLRTLAGITEEQLSFHDMLKVVLSNYFLALITPGASGGAVAQVMFMKKAGVPVARSTVIILVRTIMSILFLILIIPFFISLDTGITSWVPLPVIAGVSLAFIMIPVMGLVFMNTDYPERLIYKFSGRFSHKIRRRAFDWYHEFKNAVFIMKQHPGLVLRAFIESGLSLTFIYLTVPVYFAALNFDFNLLQVMGRMYLLNLVLYF